MTTGVVFTLCVHCLNAQPINPVLLSFQVYADGLCKPADLGSPDGPNQCCCGAAVVRARMPAYVVPLIVLPNTLSINWWSFDT